MSNPVLVVTPTSYLTLNYRLATLDGENIISTFNERPATLQMGSNQLAPGLQQALLGLEDGAHVTKELQPESGFGQRSPELIQRVSMNTLRENSAFNEQYVVGDLVDFAAPSGGKFAGVILEINDDSALFDFNHPLAGQNLLFEVQIIGIM
jgi:FKBP-type peptidyl-prolyl cis-trans isomerase SlpA